MEAGKAPGVNYLRNEKNTAATRVPFQDPDGDSSVNSNEFIASTLPGASNSYFRIEGFAGTNISWNAVSGRTYSVYWTDSLQHPFVPMVGNPTGGIYTSSQSITNPTGFYRINVKMD
jgi:hypothetical protein